MAPCSHRRLARPLISHEPALPNRTGLHPPLDITAGGHSPSCCWLKVPCSLRILVKTCSCPLGLQPNGVSGHSRQPSALNPGPLQPPASNHCRSSPHLAQLCSSTVILAPPSRSSAHLAQLCPSSHPCRGSGSGPADCRHVALATKGFDQKHGTVGP